MNKQKIKIFIMTFIIGAYIALLGTTYAYFQLLIIENKEKESINASTKLLEISYEDGSSIISGSHNGYIYPGETFKKYWTVKNTGDDKATYNIILRDIVNNFTRQEDWTYELGIVTDTYEDGIIDSKDSVTLLSINPIQFPDTNEKVTILANEILEYNQSKTYVLIAKYANVLDEQSDDIGKTLTATIDIESSGIKK